MPAHGSIVSVTVLSYNNLYNIEGGGGGGVGGASVCSTAQKLQLKLTVHHQIVLHSPHLPNDQRTRHNFCHQYHTICE